MIENNSKIIIAIIMSLTACFTAILLYSNVSETQSTCRIVSIVKIYQPQL